MEKKALLHHLPKKKDIGGCGGGWAHPRPPPPPPPYGQPHFLLLPESRMGNHHVAAFGGRRCVLGGTEQTDWDSSSKRVGKKREKMGANHVTRKSRRHFFWEERVHTVQGFVFHFGKRKNNKLKICRKKNFLWEKILSKRKRNAHLQFFPFFLLLGEKRNDGFPRYACHVFFITSMVKIDLTKLDARQQRKDDF